MTVSKSLPLDQAERAYEAVDGLFARHQNETLEIEILPPLDQAAPPQTPAVEFGILEEESCVGIPKDTLTMAYIHAKTLFFKLKNDENSDQHAAFNATRVMLLFDPEHITAANYRKKRLLQLNAPSTETAAKTLQLAVHREFILLNSILTSPLHRQTKSPTLWYHRAWLFENFLFKWVMRSKEALGGFVHAELTAVCISGERHPKNYYAWQYARNLWFLIRINWEATGAQGGDLQNLAGACVGQVAEWCRVHPGDISGWSFLAYMLPSVDSTAERTRIVDQALEYAVNINWQGESLWWFVRTVLAEGTVGDERDALMRKIGQNQDAEGAAARALKWIQTYQAKSPAS